MSQVDRSDPREVPIGRWSAARRALELVGFVGGFVFLLAVAGLGVDEFLQRTRDPAVADKSEVARWSCLESFIRASTSEGERLGLHIEPADDVYVYQRVVESVYPAVKLTDSGTSRALRVVVRAGDDPTATCPGLELSFDSP